MKAYDCLAENYGILSDPVADEKRNAYVVKELKSAPNITGVDVGAGTAISTVAIKNAGYEVSGTDASEAMLSAAFAFTEGKIPFYLQRAETLSGFSDLGFVTAVNDVVNYLSPKKVVAFFERAYRSLAKNGLLIFDVSSPYKYRSVLDGNVFCDDGEDVSYIWFNKLSGNKMIMDLTFYQNDGLGKYVRKDERHVQYVHEMEFLVNALTANGFKVKKVKTTERGERMVFSAVKK